MFNPILLPQPHMLHIEKTMNHAHNSDRRKKKTEMKSEHEQIGILFK